MYEALFFIHLKIEIVNTLISDDVFEEMCIIIF